MISETTMKYSLEDVMIIPSRVSDVNSRKKCNPKKSGITHQTLNSSMFPIITAPMDSVVSERNYRLFMRNGINVVIPRTTPFETRLELCKTVFCSFSLSEVKDYFLDIKQNCEENEKFHILIDIANGHMSLQLTYGAKLRGLYKDKLILMGGNIANPATFLDYETAGFDYVRVGIGGGAGCLTSTQLGLHYPMASLLDEMSKLKKSNWNPSKLKIIADGGIYTYSDVTKCLALGADYVMMGRALAQSIEASGDIYLGETLLRPEVDEGSDIANEDVKVALENNHLLTKTYHGMSTKEAQAKISGTELTRENRNEFKTSEGKTITLEIKYDLKGWVDNLSSYLRSAMSYCNCIDLKNFGNRAQCIIVSPTTRDKINNK